jgi:hypothetical protein
MSHGTGFAVPVLYIADHAHGVAVRSWRLMPAVGTAAQAPWTQRSHRASTMLNMRDTDERISLFKTQAT